MTSLTFPDLNLWLALATADHVHFAIAKRWWEKETAAICFTRSMQLSLLRLVTTAAVMNGKPLNRAEAWRLYDRFFEDDRVMFFPEPPSAEAKFRRDTAIDEVSPKVWADAWLLAVAEAAGGVLVTFDRALARRGARCLLGAR
jgi:toxin-antitoxin system PIN domain toxin